MNNLDDNAMLKHDLISVPGYCPSSIECSDNILMIPYTDITILYNKHKRYTVHLSDHSIILSRYNIRPD